MAGREEPKVVSKSEGRSVAPSKCYLAGEGHQRAAIAQPASFTVNLVNEDGSPCLEALPTRIITCQLVSSVNGRSLSLQPRLLHKVESRYEFTYTPIHSTRESVLSVKVCDEDIAGSPFSVAIGVAIAIHAFKSGPIEVMKGLISPHGVAVLSDRMRVITEPDQDCVCNYDHNGTKVSTIGERGSGLGQFHSPRGVAVDSMDNIYITDSGNHRIQKFSKCGDYISAVGTKEGKKQLQFSNPSGISVDIISGKIFVADTNNHRIQVLNIDLSFSHTFGKKGSNVGQFLYPNDVAVSVNEFVYVADTDNNRIQAFTVNGDYVRHFGNDGLPGVNLDQPLGVAVDCMETAIVTSSKNHHTCVYNCHGSVLLVLGRRGDSSRQNKSKRRASMKGMSPGEFACPVGVTIDAGGFVYIIDRENGRMQMYL